MTGMIAMGSPMDLHIHIFSEYIKLFDIGHLQVTKIRSQKKQNYDIVLMFCTP